MTNSIVPIYLTLDDWSEKDEADFIQRKREVEEREEIDEPSINTSWPLFEPNGDRVNEV